MTGLNLLSTDKNSAAFSPGYAPTDTGDLIGPSFQNVRQNYTTDAEVRLIGDPLHTRNALIQQRTGRSVSDITGTAAKYTNPTTDGLVAQATEDNDLIDQHIMTGRKENPGIWDGIKTTAEIRAEGKKVADEATKNFEDLAIRNPSTLSRTVGSMAGGMAGAMTDPLNIATLPLGAGETKAIGAGAFGVARGIALAAAKEGAIQAAIEAASIPQIASWQNQVGHKYGLNEAASDVAMGFLGGAAIRGGMEGAVPALRAARKGTAKASSYMLDQVATRAPGLTQSVKDSLKYMSRAEYIDEDSIVPITNHAELREHRAAAAKVADDVDRYERPAPELPGVQKIVTPRNELEIEVKPRLVELSDLVTSDRKEFDQGLQPRDRANRMASDVRINEIAARLDPAQLGDSRVSNTGSPIVGPDMMVESGNGRVMALARAYEAHPESAKAYRDYLESQGYKTAGMKQPVLIRQRLSDLTPEQRKDFVVFSNEDVDGPMKSFDTLKQREGINAYSYFDNNVRQGEEPRIVESNDPRYAADESAGPGLQRAIEEGGPGQSAEIEGQALDRFFDDNAYRLREYRDQGIAPPDDLEVKPTERLEASRARFGEIVKENPDMLITMDDGSSLKAADYLALIEQDERVIEAITTCRVA